MIYFVSLKKSDILRRALGENAGKDWIEILQLIPAKPELNVNDQVYLDITGLTPAEIKKAIVSLKRNECFWGIIDPKGEAEDPAAFFFDGASDYIGPKTAKDLSKKRLAAALSWRSSGLLAKAADEKTEKTEIPIPIKKKTFLPGKFEGWKSVRPGTTYPFFFMLVSITGKSNLRTMIGEGSFNIVKTRLRDVLERELWEADALLWIETEYNTLYLIPSKPENGKTCIEAALKMILNSRVITIEDLGLSIQVDFTFSLHYGETIYQTPGKTGKVISETVNYVYHLGARKAEPGRLTISDEVPEDAIPDGLKDFFIDAGTFENIPVKHSKRFVYE